MSRHNRRRRRHARHSRHQDVPYWDLSNVGTFGPINPTNPQTFSQHPKTISHSLLSSHCRGLQALANLPSSSGWLANHQHAQDCLADAVYNSTPSSANHILNGWQSHKAMMDHDQDCDSICKGMTNVVEFLFDGMMDYDDEEMERKAVSSRRESTKRSDTNFSFHGVII